MNDAREGYLTPIVLTEHISLTKQIDFLAVGSILAKLN